MRLNKFVAQASGLSRRAADAAIGSGRVAVNDKTASLGTQVESTDQVTLDGRPLFSTEITTILLNKPAGYICSRDGQGGRTIYDLLPPELHHLKPVGRLDKDSSGLLLMTNDGDLANHLTHPRYSKTKVYEVELSEPLAAEDKHRVEQGVQLEDGLSKLRLSGSGKNWHVTMTEGRNRQIRRTFAALGYSVHTLNRTSIGPLGLDPSLKPGEYSEIDSHDLAI